MNKIPKYKSKNDVSQVYIKVTKKESLEKNNIKNFKNIKKKNNNNSKNISQKKLNFSNKNSSREFGKDVSAKIKNSISPNIIHNPKNRKAFSNAEDKVNKIFFYIFLLYSFL